MTYTEREALKKLVDEGVKISDATIMVPVDVQNQAVYVKGLVAPMKDVEAYYKGTVSLTFADTESTQSVLDVPTGYYAIIWNAYIETDANTSYAYFVADGNKVCGTQGASFSGTVINGTIWPFGIPVKTSFGVTAVAVAGATATVKARIWYWLVPLNP